MFINSLPFCGLHSDDIYSPINLPSAFLSTSANEPIELHISCSNAANASNNKRLVASVNRAHLPLTLVVSASSSDRLDSLQLPYSVNEQAIGFSQIRFVSLDAAAASSLRPRLVSNSITYKASVGANSTYFNVDYSRYQLLVTERNETSESRTRLLVLQTQVELLGCARYTALLFRAPASTSTSKWHVAMLTDIEPNGVHLAWQLVQIVVMTVAEIMFSISGISFAYSQAPANMKSAVQALWCLTVAVGNLVVVVVAKAKMVHNQVYEYVLFAGLLSAATLVFMLLAYFYKYVDVNVASSADAVHLVTVDHETKSTLIDPSTFSSSSSSSSPPPPNKGDTSVSKRSPGSRAAIQLVSVTTLDS